MDQFATFLMTNLKVSGAYLKLDIVLKKFPKKTGGLASPPKLQNNSPNVPILSAPASQVANFSPSQYVNPDYGESDSECCDWEKSRGERQLPC